MIDSTSSVFGSMGNSAPFDFAALASNNDTGYGFGKKAGKKVVLFATYLAST